MNTCHIGPCILHCGDAMTMIPQMLADGFQADCIVCDPPYRLTRGGKGPCDESHKRMVGCFDGDKYDNGGQIVDCDIDWGDFMPLLYASLGEGHAYVMANNRNVQVMLNAAEAAGFRFHNLLVWDKVSATPNRWYMKNMEFTGLFYKGPARAINDCSSMALVRYPHQDASHEFSSTRESHPTEKPVALMEHYIRNSTQPGEIVFDPFAGSFTTACAAVRSDRRFVGIEKNHEFFSMGVARVTKEISYIQLSLF